MEKNKEDYVDYELAEMLKEVGFNWETSYYYDAFSKEHQVCYNSTLSNHNCFSDETSCPTLSLVQKWLGEKHNIVVEVWCNDSGYNCDVTKTDGTFIQNFENYENSNDGGMFDKYEDALMNAFKWVCKYSIKLNNHGK